MITREWFHSGFLPPALAYAIGLGLLAAVLLILWREVRSVRHRWRWLLVVTRTGLVGLAVLLLAAQAAALLKLVAPQQAALLPVVLLLAALAVAVLLKLAANPSNVNAKALA